MVFNQLNEHKKSLDRLRQQVRLFVLLGIIAFLGWMFQAIIAQSFPQYHWLLLIRAAWWLVFLFLMARVFCDCMDEMHAWTKAAQTVIEEHEGNLHRLREQNNELITVMQEIRETRKASYGASSGSFSAK